MSLEVCVMCHDVSLRIENSVAENVERNFVLLEICALYYVSRRLVYMVIFKMQYLNDSNLQIKQKQI